jgi:hypothetical protein
MVFLILLLGEGICVKVILLVRKTQLKDGVEPENFTIRRPMKGKRLLYQVC